MGFDDSFADSDFKTAQMQTSDVTPDLTLLDAAKSGFEESIQSGPTAAIGRFFVEQTAEKNLSAAEANEKYNLEDTSIAYKEGEVTSDIEAEIASSRYFERRLNEDIISTIEEEEGGLATASMFLGSLAGGFIDPVNMVGGIVAGKALAVGAQAAKANFMLGGKALATAELFANVGNNTYKGVFAKEIAENLVDSAVIDLLIVPLGEDVIREKTSTEQRVFNTLGGALFGTALGGGIGSYKVHKARKISHGLSKTLGTGSDEIISDVIKESSIAVANGKVPNPDHVVTRKEMEFHNTRPDQEPYVFVELDGPRADEVTWHVGRRMDQDHLDQGSYRGEGVIVASDNPNFVRNRVSSITGDYDGESFIVAPAKGRKILTKAQYDGAKSSIREGLKNVFDNLKDTKVRSTFLQDLQKSVNDSVDIDDLADRLHDIVDDFKNVPNISEVINAAIHNAGFDGYHFTGSPMSRQLSDAKYNGLVMFKPEYFDPNFKGKRSLYIGKAKTKTSAVKSNSPSDNILYNPNVVEVYPPKIAKFDAQHPNAPGYLKPFRDHESAEVRRLDSHTSDRDYQPKTVEYINTPKVINQDVDLKRDVLDVEGYDSSKELLDDMVGADKALAEKHAELIDSPNKASEAVKALLFDCLGAGKR